MHVKNYDFVVFRITVDLVLSKPYTGQESDSLVDGTLEVLERECIDKGIAR